MGTTHTTETCTPGVLARVLQLASPASPVGSYAYSEGLEQAVHAGAVHDEPSAERWIGGLLAHAVCAADVPVLLRMHEDWRREDAAAALARSAWLLACRETRELRLADLTDPDAVERGSATALIAVGTCTPNHVESGLWLRQWCEWLQPGGVVCLSLRTDFWQTSLETEDGIGSTCLALVRDGKWRELEVTAAAPYTPNVSEVTFHVRTYQLVG